MLSASGWLAKAAAAAAELNLAGLVAQAPRSTMELAEATGTNPAGLGALVGMLASQGIFALGEDGTVSNTEISARLDATHPESMSNLCRLMAVVYDAAWVDIVPMLRDGESSFEHRYGKALYGYLADHPEHERMFHLAMQESVGPVAAALMAQCDLSGVGTVVDVGGGTGALLRQLLAQYPEMTGICADRAEAHAAVRTGPAQELDGRLGFAVVDMFDSLPEGADLYIIKNVLHDWKPESVQQILTVVRNAASTGARLLVVEPLDAGGAAGAHQLFKMVVCESGTVMHSPEQMRDMAEKAGFSIGRQFTLPSGHTVLDCVAG
jgi:hypothetical protein